MSRAANVSADTTEKTAYGRARLALSRFTLCTYSANLRSGGNAANHLSVGASSSGLSPVSAPARRTRLLPSFGSARLNNCHCQRMIMTSATMMTAKSQTNVSRTSG
jgi:hypothetical protein